ncbi:hypothetical protein BX666DRAFT_1863875 [Dichotomocladium elegans]|nr:hypothetical protein BX666DRAFT_1863875 [Dichotomocladium elegans]
MEQLKNLFGTTRVPARPRDMLVTTWPATTQHIIVLFKDQLFAVPVFDTHNQALSVKAMENQLSRVVDQVTNIPKEQLLPPIGFLTCEDRNTWADMRAYLLTNPTNATSLATVESALFALCLDDFHSPRDLDQTHRDMFHGKNGHNRWFDKSFQLIVENNGLAGINAEHSSADALVQLNMFNFALRHLVLHYPSYGSDFIKAANMSPDSWMQMVFQLAYYRLYGRPCPTYEAASTRRFLTGRTEAVRSCSMESLVFTKEWEDKSVKVCPAL